MKLTVPLKWHGGKYYLASKIVAMLPKPSDFGSPYVEPYFGGGSVLLAKDPEGWSEVVNDINGDLMNFWTTLQSKSAFTKMSRLLQVTPFSEVEYKRAVEGLARCPDADLVQRAVWFFIVCRQSQSGRMTSFALITRNRTRRKMNEQVSAWLSGIDGLESIRSRLQRVLILNRSALEVIWEQDCAHAAFYFDPPYLPETRTSKSAYGKFEMTRADHVKLLDTAKQMKGRVLFSGYDSDLYNKELKGWNKRTFKVPNNAAGGKKKRRMTEVVWYNF